VSSSISRTLSSTLLDEISYFINFIISLQKNTSFYIDLSKNWRDEQFCHSHLSCFTEKSFLFYSDRLPHYAWESLKLTWCPGALVLRRHSGSHCGWLPWFSRASETVIAVSLVCYIEDTCVNLCGVFAQGLFKMRSSRTCRCRRRYMREERLRREDEFSLPEWNLLGRKWFHYRAKMGYTTSRRRWIRFADAIAQPPLVLFTKIFLDKRFEVQTIKESDNVVIETSRMQKAKIYLFKIVDEDEDEFSHTCNFWYDGVLDFIFD